MSAQIFAVDPKLKNFGTDRMGTLIDAVNEHGSIRAAEVALGLSKDGIGKVIRLLKKRASIKGHAPEHDLTKAVPEAFDVKGVSSHYVKNDTTGELELSSQWVKTRLNDTRAIEAVREFVEYLVKDAKGLSPMVAMPEFVHDDLLAVYPMGDPHFGMLSIADEGGVDFDLSDAEAQTKAAFDRLVSTAPPTRTAIIAELGDFFHSDNESNRTARSGNALDVSTRWSKVMQVGLRTMIHCILRTLEKHEKVIVRIVRGNHDTHSSFALALALDAFFSNNDRVEVSLSASAFWYYEFGKVLIGLTHGDTAKPNDLPEIMVADMPEAIGRTKFRYWYHGHIHHKRLQEYRTCLVESFNTLAARDAWHSAEGYRSGRDMQLIVHHAEYGEHQRHRVEIGRILKDIKEAA